MKTRITELFGIEHPIIQGGMHHVGLAEMAAAVSNAGGLGIITGLTQPTPDDLAKEIARCREMTDKPIGVNLTFLPGFASPDYPGYIKSIIEGGVKIVETAGRSPEQYMPSLKEAGIAVIGACCGSTPEHLAYIRQVLDGDRPVPDIEPPTITHTVEPSKTRQRRRGS